MSRFKVYFSQIFRKQKQGIITPLLPLPNTHKESWMQMVKEMT